MGSCTRCIEADPAKCPHDDCAYAEADFRDDALLELSRVNLGLAVRAFALVAMATGLGKERTRATFLDIAGAAFDDVADEIEELIVNG